MKRLSFALALLFGMACKATNHNTLRDCTASDTLLFQQKAMLCGSLTQQHTSWCGNLWENTTSKPSRLAKSVVYMQNILNTLVAPTLLNTTARETISWLNSEMSSQSIGGNG